MKIDKSDVQESDLGSASSAESAAPYVSELPTAFVRFSNPNPRPDERKCDSLAVSRERDLAQAHQQNKNPTPFGVGFCFGDPSGNRTRVSSVRG